ncbi:hypothetical protein ANN_01307 [Periplaneta americana]|uniref:Uncharacterized protein n=1 Tax=Periplaneta americana TaxID=6978 RepID=A0ABQ8TUU6_PERAM|nr:hypothetical protein ANN_01307 [Periplaneta americana]
MMQQAQIHMEESLRLDHLLLRLQDRIRNTDIRIRSCMQDAVRLALRLKWKWGGHMSRMDCSRWTYASTMWDPRVGKRSRRRPRRRWPECSGERLERSGREQRGTRRLEEITNTMISYKLVQVLQNSIKSTGMSPKDQRGIHHNHHNKKPDVVFESVLNHIKSFKGRKRQYGVQRAQQFQALKALHDRPNIEESPTIQSLCLGASCVFILRICKTVRAMPRAVLPCSCGAQFVTVCVMQCSIIRVISTFTILSIPAVHELTLYISRDENATHEHIVARNDSCAFPLGFYLPQPPPSHSLESNSVPFVFVSDLRVAYRRNSLSNT